MALKWLFSPKTKAEDAEANNANRLERTVPHSAKKGEEAPVKAAEVSEHNTGTLQDSGSSLASSAAMPSSVVVDVVETASTVSEMDERSISSEEEEETSHSSNDFNSYCDQVGNGRPVETNATKTLLREPSSKRIPAVLRSASCRIMGNGKSPNRLSFSMRSKLSQGGPAAEALKVSLDVPDDNDRERSSRNRTPSTKLARSKSLACLPPKEDDAVACDSTTIPRTGAPDSKKRDHCPEIPHRKASMSPKQIKRSQDSKENVKKNKTATTTTTTTKKKKSKTTDKSRRSSTVSEEKSPENTAPTVPPEVMKSYVDQLQKRRKKKELVRNIRGRRAQEEDTKRKQLSHEEMDEYLTIIKEVRMAKRQAKSRAMQEAIAMQRADFLARLIHVSEAENKATNPISPSVNSRI